MGDESLTELLMLREVRETRLHDFFDLADALLDPASVQRALERLDRSALAALNAVGQADTETTSADVATRLAALGITLEQTSESLGVATRLALLDPVEGQGARGTERSARGGADRWIAYGPVADQLATWPSLGLPGFDELVTAPAPAALAPVSASDVRFIDHIAGEHAFNSTNAIAEFVAEIQRTPARELARGGIALPDSKRLAAAMAVELQAIPALIDIAARAGLAAQDAGQWLPTVEAAEWMLRPSSERWAHLAGAWFARLPGDIRNLLSGRPRASWGERLADYLRWLYPAGGEWMRDRFAVYSRDSELLGITANSDPSTPGTALLEHGEAAAASAMAALFPTEVDRVYVQHDLSIVSPGPLLPRLDARLRVIADVESRALATSYRVTQASMNRAMALGETADGIRALLAEISLTGIPQPLDYLIAETATRFGALRVGRLVDPEPGEAGARSYVSSADTTLLRTVLVDHGLGALSLTRVSPTRAVSHFDYELVFWSLSEARYPAAAEDADGRIILLERKRIARAAESSSESPAAAIVRKLRLGGEATSAETGQAWLERQIETAIRGKIALTVTVAMPDGSSIDLQLEPASLAGGRLRARDRRSDLERTLPLSSITSVGPAE